MKKIHLIIILLVGLTATAQQDPQYTQYMYNMNIINPAYAGSTGTTSIGALYRSQWVGLEGAPSTGTISLHSPVGKRVGLGLSFINNKIGPIEETNAYADFSYTLPISEATKLAFGLKAGATFHNIGTANLAVSDPGDGFFAQNVNEVTPNIGVGAYYYKPNKYYLSASLPNMLNSVHLDVNGNKYGSEVRHFFAAAGYVFNLSENFKLKPHAFAKLASDSPISFDVNANLFMYDLVEIGAGYRLEDSFSAMINFMLSPNMRIGYAYDSIQSDLNVVSNSSHEIFINFDINISPKVSRSPRYF
jgi:type IX secretion system PorP/SprF family membrane protein